MDTNLQQSLESLERALKVKEAEAEEIKKAMETIKGLILVVAPGTLPKAQEYAGLGGLEAARRFLREVGEPKTTREILDAITARGWTTTAKDPLPSLYATLRNAKKDLERQGDMWMLKEAR